MKPSLKPVDADHAAQLRGRAEGLAMGALAVGCVAFVNMLGAEKALLAITLAVLALGGGLVGGRRRGWAYGAIGLGVLYLGTLAVLIAIYHDKFAQLIRLLKDLG